MLVLVSQVLWWAAAAYTGMATLCNPQSISASTTRILHIQMLVPHIKKVSQFWSRAGFLHQVKQGKTLKGSCATLIHQYLLIQETKLIFEFEESWVFYIQNALENPSKYIWFKQA